jgi:GABA(A) receptor-associated protein
MDIFRSKPFDQRKAECLVLREKYPDRIPIICDKLPRSDVPKMDKCKYLIPDDATVGQVISIIRKRIKLSPEKGLFLFIGTILPPTAATLSLVYSEYKSEDGFLYIHYAGESTFGGC